MGPGFRYHVASLAGVFLALGIGVVIGSSFVQAAIVQRQTQQLAGLRMQFKTDILALRDQNHHYSDLVTTVFPVIAASQAKGVSVVIIQTGDYDDAARIVRDTFTQAGATVTGTLTLDRAFTAKLVDAMADLNSSLGQTHPGLSATAQTVMRILATAAVRGDANQDLDKLRAAGLLGVDGDVSQGAEYAVLVGGAQNDKGSRVDTVDTPLIREMKKLPVKVIEVEPQAADISYIGSLRDNGITTIDDVDTDIGRLSLVLSLRSPAGDYGVKSTAASGIAPGSPG